MVAGVASFASFFPSRPAAVNWMVGEFRLRINRAKQDLIAMGTPVRSHRQVARLGEDDPGAGVDSDGHLTRAGQCFEFGLENRASSQEITLLQLNSMDDFVPRKSLVERSASHRSIARISSDDGRFDAALDEPSFRTPSFLRKRRLNAEIPVHLFRVGGR